LALAFLLLVFRDAATGQDGAPCDDSPAHEPAADVDIEPATPKGMVRMALSDAGEIFSAPVHWRAKDWLLFGGALGGVVGIAVALDSHARDWTQDPSHRSRALNVLADAAAPFGEEGAFAIMIAYGVAGFGFHNEKARDIAVDSGIASILAAGLITPTLEYTIGRARPFETPSRTSFHPFSGDTAFPSGHATQAFAVASVVSAHSDSLWVTFGAYSLAGLVCFARVYQNNHWLSDMAAGAVIGTAVGQAVVRINRRIRERRAAARIAIAPIVDRGRRGIGIMLAY
jgi:membrane-associated phospholipid phosphatase